MRVRARSNGLTKQEKDSKRNECALPLLNYSVLLANSIFLYYILFNVAVCVYFSNRMIVFNSQLARIRIGLVATLAVDMTLICALWILKRSEMLYWLRCNPRVAVKDARRSRRRICARHITRDKPSGNDAGRPALRRCQEGGARQVVSLHVPAAQSRRWNVYCLRWVINWASFARFI